MESIHPIYLSHAQLFKYKDSWIPINEDPVPTSILFDSTRGLYRLIAVDGPCKYVIANCTIDEDLVFHKTSQRFGHWSDRATGTVYGIGFKTSQQLEDFSECINKSKDAVSTNPTTIMPSSNLKTSSSSSTPSPLMAEVSRLKQDNGEVTLSLVRHIDSVAAAEDSLRSYQTERSALSLQLESLGRQIQDQRARNQDLSKECDYLKQHYLSGGTSTNQQSQQQQYYYEGGGSGDGDHHHHQDHGDVDALLGIIKELEQLVLSEMQQMQ